LGEWGGWIPKQGAVLTSSLFTVHVRLAAGRECRDVQLPRNMSPTRYRGRMPDMNGALCGVSARKMGKKKMGKWGKMRWHHQHQFRGKPDRLSLYF